MTAAPPPDNAHEAALAGLAASALARPPFWPNPASRPPLPPPRRPGEPERHGAWCTRCGSPDGGGRWWTERQEPKGWRCMSCLPPGCVPASAIEVVET